MLEVLLKHSFSFYLLQIIGSITMLTAMQMQIVVRVMLMCPTDMMMNIILLHAMITKLIDPSSFPFKLKMARPSFRELPFSFLQALPNKASPSFLCLVPHPYIPSSRGPFKPNYIGNGWIRNRWLLDGTHVTDPKSGGGAEPHTQRNFW